MRLFFLILFPVFASLAQLAEQLIRNEQVVGSSPMRGSKCSRTKILIKNFKTCN